MKINFGCGTNQLKGWQNYDADLDITKPLPFPPASVDYMFAEHVVEHVEYADALMFFKRCHTALKPGGVLRIAVPSIERVMQYGTEDYFKFASKWSPTIDRRGAMHAILFAHGHRAPWTEGLLETSIYYAGFDKIMSCDPGLSVHAELQGVEGHARVIGEEFNNIETVVVEGTK